MIKQIFVNLPAKNLEDSKQFWLSLGFTFNPQFTSETGASLELGENIYGMLLTEEFFSTFTKKPIVDATTSTEVITAIALNSKEEVDTIMEKAIAAGGKETRPTEDHGWMYGRAFQDIDGHMWEPVFMDFSKVPADPTQLAQ